MNAATNEHPDASTADRRLVVTADDFGMCPEVDAGVIRAHVDGIVTATSLMVRRPYAPSSARLAASHPHLALGLHLDLGEWAYRAGAWHAVDVVVDTDDPVVVAAEIERQLGRFVRLTGSTPTHLDGHQHVQRDPVVGDVLLEIGGRLGVPVRGLDPRVPHCGAFHGQDGTGQPYPEGITPAALVRIIGNLAEGPSELGCHPGIDVPASITTYAHERTVETATLCDLSVRAALERAGVHLVRPDGLASESSFADTIVSGRCERAAR